jgi:hypothetical protein
MQPAPPEVRSQNTLYVQTLLQSVAACILIWQGSRCVQNKEAHLCTTTWKEGYNPSVHRRYPRTNPPSLRHSAGSSDTSSTLHDTPVAGLQKNALAGIARNIAAADTHSVHPLAGHSFPFGESKFLNITIDSLLNEKDAATPDSDLLDHSIKDLKSFARQDAPSRIASFCSIPAKAMEVQHVETLLPSREVVMTITDYYHKNMLYWMGGLYHGPSFRRDLIQAYGSGRTLDLQALDWRWNALLCMHAPITQNSIVFSNLDGVHKSAMT